MNTRLILLAHGSSDPAWAATFFSMTEGVRARYPDAQLAFMELSEPSLQTACTQAATEGATKLTVLPLFLAKGRHLKTDIPRMLSDLADSLGIDIELLPPIGEDLRMQRAIVDILEDHLS